jgi:hypothetical protein
MSLHLRLALEFDMAELNSSNGYHGEQAMLAMAQAKYVRDQSAQGTDFEFQDPVT